MSELPDPETFGDYAAWPGREVHGPGGRIGTVVEIYLDDATDRPEWVLVDLEEGSRFVPLANGSVAGETIRVAHGAAAVGRAPDFALSKELTQEQERELYDHYAVPVSEDESDSLLPDPEAEPEPTPEPEPTQPLAAAPDPTPTPEPEPEPGARADAHAGADARGRRARDRAGHGARRRPRRRSPSRPCRPRARPQSPLTPARRSHRGPSPSRHRGCRHRPPARPPPTAAGRPRRCSPVPPPWRSCC